MALVGGTMLGVVSIHAGRVDDPISESAQPATPGLLVTVAVLLP